MRYRKSKSELERVKQIIPLGSQTFSKAYNRWPAEAPHFLTHGKGGRVWDVDGNEYVDLVGGLLPIVLGYCDEDVDDAITKQLRRGISFSLPTLREAELADRLCEHIPCAEMVRLGKNGSDVTSAAIRLARAVTGRDHIIMCGYHGWHDWCIGTADRMENREGVPLTVQDMTTQIMVNPDQFSGHGSVPFVDWEKAGQRTDIAAIILDCSRIRGFEALYAKHLADSCGALLIFDEIISGFRFDIGGCQNIWGIKPDLACFSKAMGNGMPISALVGKKQLMKNFDHVMFSGTFGGETLSIAAAIACIDKIDRENVCQQLEVTGNLLKEGFGNSPKVWLTGHQSFQMLNFDSAETKEKYITSMLSKGVLVNTSLNVCYAHTMKDLDQVCDAHHHSLQALKLAA